jgi:hypothetical protein
MPDGHDQSVVIQCLKAHYGTQRLKTLKYLFSRYPALVDAQHPLMTAVADHMVNESLLQLLIDAGADPMLTNDEALPLINLLFMSPEGLMFPSTRIARRACSVVKLLFNAGVDPLVCNHGDMTLLMTVISAEFHPENATDTTTAYIIADILDNIVARFGGGPSDVSRQKSTRKGKQSRC